LLDYGDLGIGTFDRMEGEMVMVDGTIYQAKADGRVYTPDLENRTPLATVCRFHPEETWTFSEPVDFAALERAIDAKATNLNVFCAVRVEGAFSYMKTHALQIQSKPYPPTADVVRACVQFEMRNVSGTIVGFRCPPYVKGVNDIGYHLHFLSDDKTQGGHIREFVMDRGTCAINICSNHVVILPENGAALAGIDMSRDLVDEFHRTLSGEH
jgi:acetolactate decarboxylase